MSVVNKDDIERRFLDAFKNACPHFPKGLIRKGVPGIEPDFIIDDQSSKVGVELASLYRDDGRDGFGVKAQAQFQERVVAEAKKRFESLTDKRFRVFVSFNERSGIANKAVARLATYLSGQILKALDVKLPSHKHPIMLGGTQLYPYDTAFSLVQVYDFEKYSDYSWTRNNVYNVEHINQDVLFSVIERKERKYECGLYSNCDSVWLLLYIHFFDPAMDQYIPDVVNFSIRASNFERIILYKTIEEKILQLYPPERKSGSDK